jgi:hypothetical protein
MSANFDRAAAELGARAGTNGGSAVQLSTSLFRHALSLLWPDQIPNESHDQIAELDGHNSQTIISVPVQTAV